MTMTMTPRRPSSGSIHASPDAPKVNVLLNGDAVLTEVDYKQGSGFDQPRSRHL